MMTMSVQSRKRVYKFSPLVIFPSSQKTIPFTVPVSAPAVCRRLPTDCSFNYLDDLVASSKAYSDSESAASPSPSASAQRRNSHGSVSSIDSKGAYFLGSIDPSLYKLNDEDDDYDIPDGHIGRVWFAVEYERESEKLLVTLIKAKNLPSRSLSHTGSCDPFVRIYLVPDERRYLQSKLKKKTCHPKFEESYVFQVSNKNIVERVLRLTVYDIDRHRRHNVIGHALYPLREHDYDDNERVVIWRDLEREVTEATSDRGEIQTSLCYNNHLERLTVGVIQGRQFKNVTDNYSNADYYVKMCLLQQNKVIKTKKTELVKRTTNPAFNESFTFKLPVSSLDIASVSLTAVQRLTGFKDKSLGRVVLGSFMFARGKELDHWNEMVGNQREQINDWHVLT